MVAGPSASVAAEQAPANAWIRPPIPSRWSRTPWSSRRKRNCECWSGRIFRAFICRRRLRARDRRRDEREQLGGLNGLAPNFQNYALGIHRDFPIFDLPSIRAREAGQSATIRAETARSEQIAMDLRAQWNRAVATLKGARNVAANTPIQVSAARARDGAGDGSLSVGSGQYR